MKIDLRTAKKVETNYSYVELFAGCGGMSLGLEAAGFRRVFANELSAMPAETYSYNLIYKKSPPTSNPEDLFTRLYSHEEGESPDPRDHLKKEVSKEAIDELKKFNGQMFVGGISQLNSALEQMPEECKLDLDLDLLSGGPPCQSFSSAGRRERGNARNNLPFEFAECAKLLNPKVVLLENVSGIVRPFKDEEGNSWHAWHEVAKAFFEIGYVPICTLSEAQEYGVSQKRRRYVMIAIRDDIATKAVKVFEASDSPKWTSTLTAIKRSRTHFEKVKNDDIIANDLDGFSCIEPKEFWPEALMPTVEKSFSVEQVIDDLRDEASDKAEDYKAYLSEKFDSVLPCTEEFSLQNHEVRSHSPKIRARFRVLRVLSAEKPVSTKELSSLSESQLKCLMEEELIVPKDKSGRKPRSKKELEALLVSLTSKKHTQRGMVRGGIAPAQLSIPDDYAHYAEDRTLTVREMARIQSFPDWYEFKSKVTTGGRLRAFEVPQYTQVGNAVPPLMARQLGVGITNFLDILREDYD